MFWLINILVFALAVTLVVLVAGWLNRNKDVFERLTQISKMDAGVEEEDVFRMSFMERIVTPITRKIGSTLGSLAPHEIRSAVELKMVYAGNPWRLNFNSFLVLQVLLGVLLPLLGLLLARLSPAAEGLSPLLIFLLAVMGFMLPYLILNSQVAKRQKIIQRSLPDMLDLLLVSVDAGLAFDMALKRVAEKMPGELSRELNKALDEIRMGKTRAEALRGIVSRTGVPDLSTFVGAVIQSEQLGSNIAKTLNVQANTMRQWRRLRAEEEAMRAPIKMLFPLVFFIFPALFVVLLGPAFIRIMEAFAGF